jgi:hypothetical protein
MLLPRGTKLRLLKQEPGRAENGAPIRIITAEVVPA